MKGCRTSTVDYHVEFIGFPDEEQSTEVGARAVSCRVGSGWRERVPIPAAQEMTLRDPNSEPRETHAFSARGGCSGSIARSLRPAPCAPGRAGRPPAPGG